MPLNLFDTVPDFAQDSTERPSRFHDWTGDDRVVLFSHPKDFAPVCIIEPGTVARLRPEFGKRGVKVAVPQPG